MKVPALPRLHLNWSLIAYGLLASGVVHIIATLIPAYVGATSAYIRLSDSLPVNEFVVLPPARPGSQVIPYQLPDTRYAICRFDARNGPVMVSAALPAQGWTLSLYTSDGTSFYEAPGRADGRTRINLMLVPPDGYFVGVNDDTHEASGNHSQVALPKTRGIAVIRAPLGGVAYAHETERMIRTAACSPKA